MKTEWDRAEERDRGRCCRCGLDAKALLFRINDHRRLEWIARRRFEMPVGGSYSAKVECLENRERVVRERPKAVCKRLGIPDPAWYVALIDPIVLGGLVDADNMATWCWRCIPAKTAEDAARIDAHALEVAEASFTHDPAAEWAKRIFCAAAR